MNVSHMSTNLTWERYIVGVLMPAMVWIGLIQPSSSVSHAIPLPAGLKPSGAAWAWGYNAYGQLGNELRDINDPPMPVRGLPVNDPVLVVSAGVNHSLALTKRGMLYAWGGNGYGYTDLGSLGSFGSTENSRRAVQVKGLPLDDPISAISSGGLFSLVATKTGKAYGWGSNAYGQLGYQGPGTNQPALIRLPAGDPVVAVAAGDEHSLALTRRGKVYTWGNNGSGQLGNGIAPTSGCSCIGAPSLVQGLPASDPVIAIAAGGAHSLALTQRGKVYAWGANDTGQLGIAANPSSGIAKPMIVQGLPSSDAVVAIAAGANHSLALTKRGSVYAWGANTRGQLGDGSIAKEAPLGVSTPMRVRGMLSSAHVIAIAASGFHSVALTAAGDVYGWGDDDFGELGDPVAAGNLLLSVPSPKRVRGLPVTSKVVAIASGPNFNVAIIA